MESSSRSWAATTRRPIRRRSTSTRRRSRSGSRRVLRLRTPSRGCSRRPTSVAELLAHLARQLVDEPDAVEVEEVQREGATVLQLRVAKDDVGKVIGRQGRIARALRAIVRASGAKSHRRVVLEILE